MAQDGVGEVKSGVNGGQLHYCRRPRCRQPGPLAADCRLPFAGHCERGTQFLKVEPKPSIYAPGAMLRQPSNKDAQLHVPSASPPCHFAGT